MSSRARSRILALLASSAVLGSCGGQEPAAVPPLEHPVSLKLAPAPDAPPPEEPRRVASFQVLGTRPDWSVLAGKSKWVEYADPSGETLPAMMLMGGVGEEHLLELRIPGRFVPEEINRIRITLAVPDQRFVRAGLMRGDQRIVETIEMPVEAGPGVQTVELVTSTALDFEPCDQLSLIVGGQGGPVHVMGAELRRAPMLASLPPFDAPHSREWKGDWREVFGVSNRRPLECSFLVRPGAVLSFIYGLPEEIRLPASESALRVTLTAEDGTLRTYALGFEHEEVVIYSKKPQATRAQLAHYMRNLSAREKRKIGRRRQSRVEAPGAGEFGDRDVELVVKGPPKPPEVLPTGFIDGWQAADVPLDELVGQRVTARFEVDERAVFESVCAMGAPRLVPRGRQAPLVLLITSSAHRADHLVAGTAREGIETPWLDLLAGGGVLFEDCWAPSNGTLSSTAAVMTGRSPRDTRAVHDGLALPRFEGDPFATLAERFQEAGWNTTAIVSSGLLSPDLCGLGRGFDRVLVPEQTEQRADDAIDELLDALQQTRGEPTFLWLQLHDAHAPYAPPGGFQRIYYSADLDPYSAELPDPERAPPDWDPDVRDLDYVAALYASEVTWIDRLMREVVQNARLRQGLVAFAGTYGESLESFGHERLEGDTLHVPLFITGAGLPEGKRVPRPVELVDLGRTLLNLAGLEQSEFPGRFLLDREALQAETAPPAFTVAAGGHSASVRADGSLLVLHLQGERRHSVELYDLEADPGCRQDLAGERPERARELRSLLVEWLRGAPELPARVAGPAMSRTARSVRRLIDLGIESAPTEAPPAWIEADCECERCRELGAAHGRALR